MDEKLEYFRETLSITGVHAQYVDELWKQNDIHNAEIKNTSSHSDRVKHQLHWEHNY